MWSITELNLRRTNEARHGLFVLVREVPYLEKG